MWQHKDFKTEAKARAWMDANSARYWVGSLIFLGKVKPEDPGVRVTYRDLISPRLPR